MIFASDVHTRVLEPYDFVRKIGQGSFGVVALAKTKNPPYKQVAIKQLLVNLIDERDIETFRREVEIMMEMKHPAILHLYSFSTDPPIIITAYQPNGSLEDVIRSADQKNWDITSKIISIYGIAVGMSYLHQHEIVHRDLKPANVLMDEKFRPMIADFGLSKQYSNITVTNSTFAGTPRFQAPEIIRGEHYSYPVDVYAFALIIYEVLSGAVPFSDYDERSLFREVVQGKRPQIPKSFPLFYSKMMQMCWDDNPTTRPTFESIVSNLSSANAFPPETDMSRIEEYRQYLNKPSPVDDISLLDSEEILKMASLCEKSLPKKAKKLYKKAAENKCFLGLYRIGKMYEGGKFGEKNMEKAKKYYLLAAEKEVPEGMNAAASLLISTNERKAIEFFERAATAGNAEAMYNIGVCYQNGKGVAKSKEIAKSFFKMGADKGHLPSVYMYALTLADEGDMRTAISYMEMAASGGDLSAKTWLGWHRIEGGDKNGFALLEDAARDGFVKALYLCGQCLIEGRCVKQDFTKGRAYLEEAAASHNYSAEFLLGKLIMEKYGKVEEGMAHIQEAANKGNSDAEFFIAKSNIESHKGDERQCQEMLRRSATAGNIDAMIYLSNLIVGSRCDEAGNLARRAFKAAANEEQRNFALFLIGRSQIGCKTTIDSGILLIHDAANAGLKQASEFLSMFYQVGDLRFGVKPNPSLAAEYYKKAHEK